MEHSYSKDIHPEANVEVMSTRSILIPRPPQCPSCHQHSASDDILAKLENHQNDSYFDQLPPALNDSIATMAMEETERLTKNVKNANADDEDWDEKVNKFGWTKQQLTLYRQATNCLDYDQLARLAVSGRPNEGIIRRCSIDKSVARMRMALASVHWNTQIIQWLHTVMSDHLPPTYMASYLDILQTLRTKVPTLVDKMLAIRPVSFNTDYMQAVMKKPWVGNVPTKSRKLPGQSPIIVIVPATLNSYGMNQQPSSRMKRWFSLLGTMASIAPIQNTVRSTQSLENITEQLIGITRSKIQDLRNEMPNRHIILVGINTGASVALQVALVENVSSVISLGFSFNTLKGIRGQPDDRILELTTPVLFVLGENSARSSQEEIESLRERMSAQTMLLKVGSADHALRIPKFNRHLEGVTQSMVDNMIADEIQDFATTCILNPPGPRDVPNYLSKQRSTGAVSLKKQDSVKKRKHKDSGSKADKGPPRKVGRPRLNRSNEIPTGDLKPEKPKPAQALLKQTNEAVRLTVQSTGQTVDLLSLPIDSTNTVSNLESVKQMEPIAIDLSSIENISQIENKPANAQIKIGSPTQTISTANIASPSTPIQDPIALQSGNQFIQIKPPTTPGRIQSPNVKNFFIRKGVEKQVTPTQTIVTSTASIAPVITSNQLSGNKKIIIKSQQIIVPASNIKQTSPQIVPLTMVSSSDSTSSDKFSSENLSDILDLPIMFADNEPSSEQQNDQVHNNIPVQPSSSSSSSLNAQIVSVANETTTTNVAETTTTYMQLPNRPVVISAAKIGKSMNGTPTHNNKVILINRGHIKQQIVTTQSVTPTSMVKTMPTIKLVPTSLSSNQVTFSNNLAKFAPGTKIDLSQLKIVKNVSANAQGGIAKQVIINNKPTTVNIGTRPGTQNAILIKTTTAQPIANPGMKANIMNRSITVRKVMNAPSKTVSIAQPSVNVSPTPALTTVVTSPTSNSPSTQSSPRILRKSKVSN